MSRLGLGYRTFFAVWTSIPKVLRYHFWHVLRRIGSWCYGRNRSTAQLLPFGLYLKSGQFVRVQEGLATQFVALNTDVPVPTVVDILDYRGNVYIVTKALPGDTLRTIFRELPVEIQERITSQLRDYLAQVRAIPPPPGTMVGGFANTPLHCGRISLWQRPFGPFASINDFHRAFLDSSMLELPSETKDDVLRTIEECYSRPHRLCLTHGDLHPDNILVDDDYNITGIIDWECGAWLPEYWEFIKSVFLPWCKGGVWLRMMTDALPGYDLEYRVNQLIIRYRLNYDITNQVDLVRSTNA